MRHRLTAVLLVSALLFGCVGFRASETGQTPEPTVPEDTPIAESVPVITPLDVTVNAATPAAPPTIPPTPSPSPTPTPLPPLYGKTIGLDPGHQARPNHAKEPVAPDSSEEASKCTAGTCGIASNVYEYQVNLDVAKKLAALLEANGATVILTRTESDVNLSNRDRAALMNEHEVDLAICLHCNGTDNTNVRGAFMLVPAQDCTNSFSENVRAASAIIDSYCAATGIGVRKHSGITYRRDQTVFNWCNRPIVCIEMGHMSNETEDLLLTNAAFQDKMAFGISEGILTYFNSEATE